MFFKKRCHCNQHNDLIKLQELNKELKECEERLNKICTLPPMIIPEGERCWGRDPYKCNANILYMCILSLIRQNGDVSNLVYNIQSYTPYFELDHLKLIGQTLINYANASEECRSLKERIKEIKEEIEKLKEKLGIE